MSMYDHYRAHPDPNGFEDAVVREARRLKAQRPRDPMYLILRDAWSAVNASFYGVAELEGSTPTPYEATVIQTRAFGVADSGQEIGGTR